MKRNVILALILSIVLAGCATGELEPTPAANNATQAPAATSAAPTSEAPADEEPADEEPADEEPADEEPADEEPADGEIAVDDPDAPLSNVPSAIDIIDTEAVPIADTNGYFLLQTLLSEEEGGCLEGNTGEESAVLRGAAFMDTCKNVDGQLWKLLPTQQEGYYQLQTRALEAENKCLEGNHISPDAALDGASFMDGCANVTGQIWKFVSAGDGLYRLQTLFKEGESMCLEGNRVEAFAILQGAAFQDTCKDVTGQVWKLTAVAEDVVEWAEGREIVNLQYATGTIIEHTDVYYQIQRVAGDEDMHCLNGNGLTDGALAGGAAFVEQCSGDPGQQWHIIPTDQEGLYRLQPLSHIEQGSCFEGNRVAPDAWLEGASFMNACSHETGQLWQFVDAGNGLYYLQTAFLAGENKCLDGNFLGDGALLQGGAYMSTCENTALQQWLLAPLEGTSTLPPVAEPPADE